MGWMQDYQPAGPLWLSALLAALPVAVLLVALGIVRLSAPVSAALSLLTALGVALLGYGMPAKLAFDSAAMGIVFGTWSVAWIAFHAVYFHNVTVATGRFEQIKSVLAGFSEDRRLQALLIAFGFGALLEGVAGGGSPIAITAAMMAALGFPPVRAVVLALLANTAPVAFGGLGNPLIVLGRLTAPIMGMDQGKATDQFSAMVGRQVPVLALIVPAFLVIVMAGWKRMIEVWPAVLTTGLTFAVMQYVTSNFISPSLVDVIAALAAMGALWVLTRFWQPPTIWRFDNSSAAAEEFLQNAAQEKAGQEKAGQEKVAQEEALQKGAFSAWMPYVILIVAIFLSRIGSIIGDLPSWLDLSALLHKADWKFPWPGLNNQVVQHPPITAKNAPYAASITIDFLFSPGTIALIAALIAGFAMRAKPGLLLATYRRTLYQMRWALLTIFMILAIAFVMNYSGATQTLGLALATTGVLFPLFSAYIGWLGVFLTGSDASANSLFGPMQVISAQQLHLSPILAGATNTAGGVMAKMISPQNLAIGATAIGQSGKEGQLLRQTFWWSVALAFLVGLIALLQATVLTWMIPG